MLQQEIKRCTLDELKEQLEFQNSIKRDYVVPCSSISMNNNKILLSNIQGLNNLLNRTDDESLEITPNSNFLQHLSTKLGITKSYQKRLLEIMPELYEYNVNALLKYSANKKRSFLLRMFELDKQIIGRAFLSNSFKLIDNQEIVHAALDAIEQVGIKKGLEIRVDSCCLTEERIYIRFTVIKSLEQSKLLDTYKDPLIKTRKKNGFVSGFILSNSEVGLGKLFIAPRLICNRSNNGYIFNQDKFEKKHLGAKLDFGILDSQSNKKHQSIKESISEIIEKFVDPEYLTEKVKYLEKHGSYELKNPIEALAYYCDSVGITDVDAVSKLFVNQSSSKTSFDVMQAVTYYAQTERPDISFYLESQAISELNKIKNFDN